MAKEEKPKITFCPNCQQQATRIGNEISCEICDTVFIITKKDGAKVKKQGRIESLEERVDRIEAQLPTSEPEPEPEPTDDEPGENDEDDIL